MTRFNLTSGRKETHIQENPYTRAHLSKLRSFRQEISAILSYLGQQEEVLHNMSAALNKRQPDSDDSNRTYTPTEGWSAQDLVIAECLSLVQRQSLQFQEVMGQAGELSFG